MSSNAIGFVIWRKTGAENGWSNRPDVLPMVWWNNRDVLAIEWSIHLRVNGSRQENRKSENWKREFAAIWNYGTVNLWYFSTIYCILLWKIGYKNKYQCNSEQMNDRKLGNDTFHFKDKYYQSIFLISINWTEFIETHNIVLGLGIYFLIYFMILLFLSYLELVYIKFNFHWKSSNSRIYFIFFSISIDLKF